MICKQILLITFLNKPNLILLYTVKWLQVLLCIINIHLNISHLFTHI